MIDPFTELLLVMAVPAAGLVVAVARRERGAPLVGVEEIDAARRAEVDNSVQTASGLESRLTALDDLPVRGSALVAAHPGTATADLGDLLAGVTALREDALGKVSAAVRGGGLLARSRPSRAQSTSVLRARRAIHDADVAVERLEALAERVADRAELLGGGRERVIRALEEHEARLARIAEASETESLRLARAEASGAPGPLAAATRAVQAVRAEVGEPHPSHRHLVEALAEADAAMARLERDVERARWEAGRA